MASIQLCVCAEFGPEPEVSEATEERVSPCLTTWVEPLSALEMLPAPRAEAEPGVGAGLGLGIGAGAATSLGGTGDMDDVSCEGGTSVLRSTRAIAPSRGPAPVDGAATGVLLATDWP